MRMLWWVSANTFMPVAALFAVGWAAILWLLQLQLFSHPGLLLWRWCKCKRMKGSIHPALQLVTAQNVQAVM